jgi:hypothetical protein
VRGIGVQQVRVEQVHINGESQAVIGNLAINPKQRNRMVVGQ